jgi:hypothetical protein
LSSTETAKFGSYLFTGRDNYQSLQDQAGRFFDYVHETPGKTIAGDAVQFVGEQLPEVMLGMGGARVLRPLGSIAEITDEVTGGERNVVFGQRRVNERFSPRIDGAGPPEYLADRRIADVAADLRAGRLHPDQLPIQAFEYDGQLVSANSRSLAALSEAGLKPTIVQIIEPTDDLLLRLQEVPLRHTSPLPGPTTYVTPSRSNLSIIRPITVPGN